MSTPVHESNCTAAVRFDDLEALRARVSDEYGPWSAAVTISQAMIEEFAQLTGDRQWIHVDVERARAASPFHSTLAHGFLVLSLASMIKSGGLLEVVGHGSALNYGIDRLRFLRPVLAASSIRGRTRLEAVEARDTGTLVTLGIAIHTLHSEVPALVFSWKLLYRA